MNNMHEAEYIEDKRIIDIKIKFSITEELAQSIITGKDDGDHLKYWFYGELIELLKDLLLGEEYIIEEEGDPD